MEFIDVYESTDSESILIRFEREPGGKVFINMEDLKAVFGDATGIKEEIVRNGQTRWAIYGPSSTGIIYIGNVTSRYMPQRNFPANATSLATGNHDISLLANKLADKLKIKTLAEIDSMGYKTYSEIYKTNISSDVYSKDDGFLNEIATIQPNKEMIDEFNKWQFTYKIRDKDLAKNENSQQHPEFLRILMQHPTIENKAYSDMFYLECPNGVILNQPYTATLRGKKPDMVLYEEFHNTNEINIKSIVELTMEDDLGKDESHLGKMIEYNHLILDIQPNRSKVISVLTNVAQMVFVMSTRNKENNGKCGRISKVMASKDGIGYLLGLLASQEDFTGFQTPTLSFQGERLLLESYLGCGTTSCCYQVNDGRVVKWFHDKVLYKKELAFYKKLKVGSIQPEHMSKYIGNDGNSQCLVFQGQGVKRDEHYYKTANFVRQLFQCLRELEKLQIIHRDITLRHFLWQKGNLEKLMIIDFGCSLIKPAQKTTYSGTAYLAANEVLQAQVGNKKYLPKHRHDWESAIKLMTIVFGFANYSELAEQVEKQRAAGQELDKTDRFQLILDYWTKKELELEKYDCFILDLLKITRSDQATLDQLEQKLIECGFFRFFY